MQWRHRSVRIALRGINKKGVEIGERQNRCHDDIYYTNLFKFDCETSIFGLCKSRSNPFLETTSTKQWEQSFLLKETTGTQTHD